MSTGAPRLYSIAPGIPFVDALAQGMTARIAAGTPDDPLALARATVLVPTRRAVRSLREAFLRSTGGRPVLLPRMMPLGDLDEDELLIAAEPGAATLPGSDTAGDLPPVIGGLRRQLLLARLVLRFGDTAGAGWRGADPGQAAELAAELARLLDQMETERVGFDALQSLRPRDEGLARHWDAVLTFLKIVTEHWPAVLKEEGAIGPAERRNRLLAVQAAAWTAAPPEGWVIAAGSTGSIPATADLLAAVARLPRGGVVLPGLDRELSDADWNALPETHLQFGLARLLAHIGVARDEVGDWSADWPCPEAGQGRPDRARLLSAAMSPGPEPAPADLDAALSDVAWLECPAPAEEAAAIALIMRGVLENEGRTAALVTPDRGLARRVAARLNRWDVMVDDSAGMPLAGTPAMVFLRALAAMVAERFAPVALLACLKHPLAAAGMARDEFRAHVRTLDRLVLRGPRPAPGIEGIRARIARVRAARAARGPDRGRDDDLRRLDALPAWIDGWMERIAPFVTTMRGRPADVGDLLSAHVAATEALAETADAAGAQRLWRGDDGEAAAGFVADLAEAAVGFAPVAGRRYPALLDALMAGRVVRPRFGRHPRLNIWGPLEARLQNADVTILAGLNEGTWPLDPGHDPWMSRPMRARIGLPLPERRIGLAAHDFAQGFAAPEVVLSRSQRVGGTPTVPSRWLLRLANLLGEDATRVLKERGAAWQARAALADRHLAPVAIARPAPKPPVKLRPRKLSVTEIETWQVNPYAVYARHVLGLDPLEAIGADPGAAERGIFIHDVMERLITRFPKGVPPGGAEEIFATLLEIGGAVLDPVGIAPGLRAIWWPRFCDIARWVAGQEVRRRARAQPLAAEKSGRQRFERPGGEFFLTGRADRIDRLADGRLAIVDYKTGSLPSARDQRAGFAPQLPLLAAMAQLGAFSGVRPTDVAEMAYWRLSGGDRGGEEKAFAAEDGVTMAEVIDHTVQGLTALIDAFDRADTPYVAYASPARVRFDDYRHLARVQEWAVEGGNGGEEA